MKMPNLKNVDYKQLGINHGEKVVIALIALMVGGVLYGSNWKATEKSPSELMKRAETAKKEIEDRPWDEQREKRLNGLGQGNELAQKVSMLLTPVSVTGFSIEPFNPPLHPDKTLISTPRWLPVQHLIADAGVANLSLRPGTPMLDEGFIRKSAKDKEPKLKGRRERMRQKEAKEKEKEAAREKKEEPTDDSIPEDLKPKSDVGATPEPSGGFGGRMGGGMGRMGRNRNADKKSKRKAPEPEPEIVTRRVATKPVGRGYHFVAVRGIFPLHDETGELARAMGVASTEKGVQSMVQCRDFKLERQTRTGPGADQWGPWEPVDRDAAVQLLENDVDGYAPETVLDGLLDGHIVMPYPERVVGQWDRFATHPDIKEFTLSDDEVEKQVAYEMKLLEKLKKEDEQNSKTASDKGGFMKLSRDMRALSRRAQSTQVGEERSIHDKILEELKAGTGDKDQMNEQLEEFVRTRATPVDHYLLFRYLDIKVEPGKTYRYRVKLIVDNPFKERRIEEVTDPSIIEGPTRETEWSEPTAPVTVQDNSRFYVKRVDWRPGRTSLPSAGMDIFQWFAETGTVVNKELQIQLGQLLGGRKSADVLRPAENVFDNESVLFSSRDALVDIAPGFPFDPALHKDVLDDLKSVPSIKRTGASAPEKAVVVDDTGELIMVDGMDQKPEYDKTKTYYEQQNKAFEALRKPADDDDDVLGAKKHRGKSKKERNDPRRDSFGRKGKNAQGKKGG